MNPPPFQPRPRKNALPTYEELSKEQDSILRLPAEGGYLIKGAPGTGKTVLTLLRAASLRKRGKSVLYILHYKVLARYCQQLVQEPLNIQSYHSWFCRHFWITYKQEVPKKSPFDYDWKVIEEIYWKRNPNDGPRKDSKTHVIIDEGQDMPQGFYKYLNSHFENIFVAADENQQISEENECVTFEEIKEGLAIDESNVFELTHNYRNTREIAAFCQTFYTGAGGRPPELPVRRGIKPLLVRHSAQQKDRLVDLICRRLRENPHQLVGFVPFKKSVEEWQQRFLAHGVTPWVYNSDKRQLNRLDFSKGGVVLTNFDNIKGLEFDRVYVPDLRQYDRGANNDKIKMKFYVLFSRPKDILIIFENTDEGADRVFSIVNRKPDLLTIKSYSNGKHEP